MDIQKEWDLFVAHLRTLGVVKIGRNALGTITNLTREGKCSLSYNDIELMWETWQAAKAQAVPEGFVLVKKVHPDAIVHNQGLGLFKECQIIYGWDGKPKDFKDALNKGFYHGVKLGAKAVLETAMIEAQENKG